MVFEEVWISSVSEANQELNHGEITTVQSDVQSCLKCKTLSFTEVINEMDKKASYVINK